MKILLNFRYLYWSDWGVYPKIERADLDGMNRKVLVNTSIKWPNGIAIDYVERKLYWGDAGTDEISSVNLDGTNKKVLIKKLPHVFGVSILGEDIFWTDWQYRKLSKANKHILKEVEVTFYRNRWSCIVMLIVFLYAGEVSNT